MFKITVQLQTDPKQAPSEAAEQIEHDEEDVDAELEALAQVGCFTGPLL